MSPVTIWQKICAALFVIITVAIWIFMSIAFGKHPNGMMYSIYLTQSVRGLTPSSLVSYNGIPVGKVADISNDFSNNRVRVDIIITKDDTKVFADNEEEKKPGTRAELITSFFTGMQYINLTGGAKDCPLLPEKSAIPAVEGGLDKLNKNLGTIEDIMTNVREMSENINKHVLGGSPDTTVGKINKILDNTRKLTDNSTEQSLHKILKNIEKMSDPKELGIKDLIITLRQEAQKLSSSVNSLTVNLDRLVKSTEGDGDITSLVNKMNVVVAENQKSIKRITENLARFSDVITKKVSTLSDRADTTLETINYFLRKDLYQTNAEMQKMIKEISSVLRIIKAKPNALLFGTGGQGR